MDGSFKSVIFGINESIFYKFIFIYIYLLLNYSLISFTITDIDLH